MLRGHEVARTLVLMLGIMILAEAAPGTDANAVRFEIVASRYAFTPSRIEVHEGDSVELVLRSADTDHGFELAAYRLMVEIPKGGAPVAVRFVAKGPGRFPFACSEYCGSGHRRMRGELVVLEGQR